MGDLPTTFTPGADAVTMVPSNTPPEPETSTNQSVSPESIDPVPQAAAAVGQTVAKAEATERVVQNVDVPAGSPLAVAVRLFGSPLGEKNPSGGPSQYALGPDHERRVDDGWEADRDGQHHEGLDFPADFGEPVYAMAKGEAVFVGAQPNKSIFGARQDVDANVLDAHNNLVFKNRQGIPVPGTAREVGRGGIIVMIDHTEEFSGFRTEYMHLAAVAVEQGKPVEEGQVIGFVGYTGLTKGRAATHLHLYVRHGGRKFDAIRLIPHYGKRHPDTLPLRGSAWSEIRKGYAAYQRNPTLAGGIKLVWGAAVAAVGGVARSEDLIQTGREAMGLAQEDYIKYVQQQLRNQQSQLYETVAKFQESGLVVDVPMTYDFDEGLWSIKRADGCREV